MLGARLGILRRRAGLSQRALAAELNVSASAIGMYEQGRRVPPNALLVAMAKRFGVSTDFLLTGESRPADTAALRALLSDAAAQLAGMELSDCALLLSVLLSGGELTAAEKSAIMEAHGGESMTHEHWMREALRLAQEAADEGEVPVGCVVVCDGEIVGRGRNRRETAKNALSHAEMEAIDEACRALGGWRLWKCTLYVTLEPCPMCTGAIINARLKTLVYGAPDAKAGSCGTLTNLFDLPYNHRPEVISGILADESRQLLQDFFRRLRENPTVKSWKRTQKGE